ncbi:phosphopeptide-binding protein [Parafrankia soli]|uniref:Phosphopeptide-binding protein n=1 Tax=Parafrankia soli TaxID=2599596 RepID=A0A1S1Q059_9ACTN|nr:FHA domain-containing protein [Parafrankia soli]OHV28278.1 phosphopeptide-binding protein [Parafrankia soli]
MPVTDPVCRACGHNAVTGTGPRAVGVVPLGRAATRAAPEATDGWTSNGSAGTGSAGTGSAGTAWAVEIAPDRAYFDRGENDGAVFPTDAAGRLIRMTAPRAVIGRRSRSRGQAPELDLSLPPMDPGVSRSHALLERHADGTVTVTDLRSANGTWLGPDAAHLARVGVDDSALVREGDHVFVGAWTRVTVRPR